MRREAVFFLATNTLIVFGLIAFDNALAIIHTFPCLFPRVPSLPKPTALVKALLLSSSKYDERRIHALQEAVVRLRGKSRSFSISSAFFYGRLRIDLIALYSFCRVADDLVDNAPSISEANHWIAMLTKFLDLSYSTEASPNLLSVDAFVRATFPEATRLTLLLLPTSYLPPDPLYDLLKGFQTDLHFSSSSLPFPILNEGHLKLYASRVAGSVAELCLELVFRYCEQSIEDARKTNIIQAGRQMGIALQYINIARDIDVDCRINRVYLPTDWLKDEDLTPEDVTHNSSTEKVEKIRRRLLKQAMAIYDETKSAIDRLPAESRGPMRVAVESYVEIGRVIDQPGYKMKAGRATVSKIQRLRVAWKALQSQ